MDDNPGERLLVTDAMDGQPWTISIDTKLEAALTELSQKKLEVCVVVDKTGVIRGGLDVRELGMAQFEGKKRKSVADLLTQPALIVSPQADLLETLDELKKRRLSMAIVVRDNNLLGTLNLRGVGARLSVLLERRDKELTELRVDSNRKDEYLGMVSHDMRAPLTVIALSTDYLLSDESVRSLSQDQKSFVERIKRNGEMASSMIHDILDVVRLEHGFHLNYQEVRFTDFLNESIENLQVVAAKKKLTFQVTHEQNIQINLDPNRMRQAIENLLVNAIKFSPQGGQILIRTYIIQKANGLNLALQVRDQGHGIRKEDEIKVFESFVQSGRSKQGKDGVGLGLAIVRKFVEFHQGTIEMDGGWQKGASITVFLPNASVVTTTVQDAIKPQGPVVLLVEDDDAIREFYKQSLEGYKYHVIEAPDGVEGFAVFQKNSVDLVLSDIRMPRMDGIELLAKIRASGSAVPVILCSGYYVGLENDLTKSSHKPNRVIDKPFKVKDMVEAIEDLLRRYKQAS